MVEGMDVAAQRRLGVRLVAQDVADEIVGLAVPAERRIPLPRNVHRAVGVQA
jgi:hypothetical protein